jgi:hypothetical protein
VYSTNLQAPPFIGGAFLYTSSSSSNFTHWRRREGVDGELQVKERVENEGAKVKVKANEKRQGMNQTDAA